ncbi:unnamed protein product, partial [Laminaria digitata]
VVSETQDSDSPLMETRDVLARFVQPVPVEVIPYDPG